MGFTANVALALFGFTILYAIRQLIRGKGKGNGRPLPPGPKGLLIIGNAKDMPKPGELECLHWLKHKELYGPISSVTVLGQTLIVINDADVALELMRERSNIHSSRPHQMFSGDMVGWKNSVAMSPYNDYWKIQRRSITKVTSSNVSVAAFDRIQEEEAAHFLMHLLANPEDLFEHIRTEAGSVILNIIYGYKAESRGRDPLVDLVNKAMWTFAESTVPGKWPVDVFPFLNYLPEGFPGTGFKKIGRSMRTILVQCTEQPYAFVKQQIREKRAKPSFLSQAIESAGTDQQMEFVHKWTALSLFAGGADTTVAALMCFFLAMTLYPEVQKKAQEELDRVIGDRIPVAADRENLPYLHAVMLETHRWHPIAPMGIPHSSVAEDVCRGYRIPKGAMLLPNVWCFTHDPATYPDPMSFNPDRFLETDTHKPEIDPRNFIFGFGRRLCPGRYVADNAVFITIAQTLAMFNITPIEGAVPKVEFEPGVVSHPKPYKTNITPRSEKHRSLVEQLVEKYPWQMSDAKELENIKWRST